MIVLTTVDIKCPSGIGVYKSQVKSEKIRTFPEVEVSNSIVFQVLKFFKRKKFLFSKNIDQVKRFLRGKKFLPGKSFLPSKNPSYF